MKSAHTPKDVSALDQRRKFTAPAPHPDVLKAVADIRAAVAALARLAGGDTSGRGGQQ